MKTALTDVELLARLVSFDSTSRNSNLPIANFVCDYLDVPGCECLRNLSADQTKVNLLFVTGGSGRAKGRDGLLLSGHLDVVPAEEPEWRSDPFTLTETEDTYVGRGACDMKGFDALAINAFRRSIGRGLTHPLALLLTFDEETGTIGAQHFVDTWVGSRPLPRHALIGEPTEMKVVRLHKGHLRFQVTMTGQSAHSAYPHLGVNAIVPAARAIIALADLGRTWEKRRVPASEHYPETPYPALNVAQVAGGTAINIIPDRCVFDVGIRVLPGMTLDELVSDVRGALRDVPGFRDECLEVGGFSPPLNTPEDAPIHRLVCDLISQRGTHAASYATDAGVLQQMGMDCVVFGPGSISVAHKPNECMPKAEFHRMAVLLDQLIDRCCGAGAASS